LTVIAALAAATVLAASAPAPEIVIQGDYKLGSYAVKRDGTLRGAIAAFGAPTRVRQTSRLSCGASWRALSLAITFYNLGGSNPCEPRFGRFGRATTTGKQWRTSKGLRVGDSLGRLRALYPRAEAHGAWRWLVVRTSPFGLGGRYAGLAAKLTRGRVSAFLVTYPAGGD
jgi:hypothetical protein